MATRFDEAAVKRYCGYMQGIKGRMEHFRPLLDLPLRRDTADQVRVESVYLQYRKILEMIAAGSLLNNQIAYAQARADFAKDWHAKRILKTLRMVNPEFYPLAIEDVPGSKPRATRARAGALTEDEFAQLYDLCGEVLHTANPFGPSLDYEKLASQMSSWFGKIVTLLNQHQLHMVGDPGLWIIQMATATSDLVHYYRLLPVDAESP